MTAELATRRGRARIEALMVDACTVTRPSGRGAYDPVTKTYGAGATADTLYSGKCRYRNIDQTQGLTEQAGDKTVGVSRHMVFLPVTVTGVRIDDLVTVTASALDPDLAGLRLRVVDVAKGTHLTARRLHCEEITL